ncbi:hypothetical protein [Caulobacter sp. X]|uniref:hypothetical protein n=1 Tax=Caulobacter sp. X TaxID=2048901 RepID=UPI000C149A12|nr:hypothetical protein [Caulobacter sp. X]PIC01420.1 hypothetical protein CSW60_07935 [Caulobacter sp. X]
MRRIGLTATAIAVVLGGGGAYLAKEAVSKPTAKPLLAAATVTPVPLPTGPDYPAPPAVINGWIAAGDTTAIRGHAWSLWQAMATPSGQFFNGQQLPIWETWATSDDVFPGTPAALKAALRPRAATLAARLAQPRALRHFRVPHQFHHGLSTKAALPFGNAAVTAFNKFSPAAATFIDAPQPGPGGGTYSYASAAGLAKLNASWPAGTTPEARGINEFPVEGVELKPVFSTVKATGLTIQPLWQGPAASTNPNNPTPDTWTTCVLVAPTGVGAVRPATRAEIASAGPAGACKTFLYAPLSTFYAVRLSAAEAKEFATSTGRAVAEGDFAVLQAMHVSTKEIPFWTWQTFWWQPGADTPNGFPGSKQNQPASLGAPWNNYAACAAYSQTTTVDGSTMQVCFNPYLETSSGIPAGLTSNCMSCHGVAVVGGKAPYPPNYNKPIAFFTDPAYFTTRTTHTDFSWAVANAQ